MIGRMLHKADFERVLAVTPCSGSAHFAVHYLRAGPSSPVRRPSSHDSNKLSTDESPNRNTSVDDSPAAHWLGCVIPKRHARRAVTRNVLRRQIRAAVERQLAQLRPGLWLVRLRRPFAPDQFRAADSLALRNAARLELDRLMGQLAQSPG